MARLMRLAYLTPLAPVQTETSYYSEELLPHLCRHAQVDVYTDDRLAAAQEVGRAYRLYGYHDLEQPGRYDHLIYQLGSDPVHLPILERFLRYGGVVVLHDADLTSLAEAARDGQGDGRSPLNGVRRSGGLLWPFFKSGYDALLQRQWLPRRWQRNGSLLEQATGVIVHSRAARRYVTGHSPRARVRQVPLGVRRPPAVDPLQARQLLGIPPQAFAVAAPLEQAEGATLAVVLQGLRQLIERWAESYCLLVGRAQPEGNAGRLIEAAGLGDRARIVCYSDLAGLYRCLAAADVTVSLAASGHGHLPPILLRAMSLGRPAVVANCPPYDELPGECALLIEPGAGEVAQLAATLWAMAAHPPMRQWYGECAARYVQAEHTPATTARHYIEFVERLSLPEVAEEPRVAEPAVWGS